MSICTNKIGPYVAENIFKRLEKSLDPVVYYMELLGSYRRGKKEIGDLDIAIVLNPGKTFKHVYNLLIDNDHFNYDHGGSKHITLTIKHEGVDTQIDVYFFTMDELGSGKLHLTGSGKHNQALRALAKSKGYKLNQYGLFKDDIRIDNNTEFDIYEKLGLVYIEPNQRTRNLEPFKDPKLQSKAKTVKGSNGNTYFIKDGKCSCLGFLYRHKCKHIC